MGVPRTGAGLLVVWPALRAAGRLNGTSQSAGSTRYQAVGPGPWRLCVLYVWESHYSAALKPGNLLCRAYQMAPGIPTHPEGPLATSQLATPPTLAGASEECRAPCSGPSPSVVYNSPCLNSLNLVMSGKNVLGVAAPASFTATVSGKVTRVAQKHEILWGGGQMFGDSMSSQ